MNTEKHSNPKSTITMITLVIYSALTIGALLFTTILDMTHSTSPSARSKRASA